MRATSALTELRHRATETARATVRGATRTVARTEVGDHNVRTWVELAAGHARSALTRAVHTGHPVDRRVVVCGSPRSGTTWLAEAINHDRRFRYCFEPEDPHHRTPRFAAFAPSQYLRTDERDPKFTVPLRDLFDGKVFSRYSDQWQRGIHLRPSDDLLVKLVNGNLFAGWIAHNIERTTVVHIVRHPLAVLRSQASLGFPDHTDHALDQPQLIHDVLSDYAEVIASATSPLERRVVEWCVSQVVPIRQLPLASSLTVRYEDLLVAPERALRGVFDAVDQPWTGEVLDRAALPSKTAWNGSGFQDDQRHHLESWRAEFTHDEIERTYELIDEFGLSFLYADSTTDVRTRQKPAFGEDVPGSRLLFAIS
ncbi:MAG: sulfotransferase [Actinobacteria bacterium]|nr:sulfotransferase [Actinomycetota bacterium]